MTKRILLISTSIMALVCAGSGLAQPRPGSGEAFRGDPREAVMLRFEAAAPKVGEPLPDIVIHDRTSKELRLRELLQGHHTVLILGCLT